MPDEPSNRDAPARADESAPVKVSEDEDATARADDADRNERKLGDFVRRAVSAGVGAAARSKDDIMRAAAGEVRNWLEHMNFNDEFAKALAKLVIEVKTEIRFRPTDDGKLVPEASSDMKVKPPR
jgi:hypothetical protein